MAYRHIPSLASPFSSLVGLDFQSHGSLDSLLEQAVLPLPRGLCPRSPFSLASPSSSLPFFALSRVSCLLTDSHGHYIHIYSSYHNLSSSFNVCPPCQTLNFRKVGIFPAFDNEHCAWKTVITTYLLTNCFEQSSIFRRQCEELKSTKLLFQGYMENLPDKISYIKGDYREGYQVEGLERQMKFSLVLSHSSVNERCIPPPSRHYDHFKCISLWSRVRAGHLNGGSHTNVLDPCQSFMLIYVIGTYSQHCFPKNFIPLGF